MKVLVTGGAGFVGSTIVDHYVAAGYDVTVVDNMCKGGGGRPINVNKRAHFYQADITDTACIAHIFDEVRPQIVNHQAAQSSVAVSTRNALLDAQVNILGLLNILTNCVRVGVDKIVFASSGTVFGTPHIVPVDEQQPLHPESPYGITKMAGESYIRYWHKAYGLSYTILRYSNTYGPRQNPNGDAGVIATFTKRFLVHEPVCFAGNGEQRKDYVYVGDIARANILALDRGDNDVFCIATGRATSVKEIYQTLVKIIGYEVEIVYAPKRIGDIPFAYFNPTKAERILGWKANVSLEEGIRTTVDFFRQTMSHYEASLK